MKTLQWLCALSIPMLVAAAPSPQESTTAQKKDQPSDSPPNVSKLVELVIKAAKLGAKQREELADKVCGTDGAIPAADSQTKDVWTNHKVGDWFKELAKNAQEGGWKYDNGQSIPDLQSLVLKAAEEGKSKCNADNINTPGCTGDGADYNKCRRNPEAHLVWIAIVNWADYCASMVDSLKGATISLGQKTGSMVGQFYTAQKDPSQLILPVSIVGGFFAALSSMWPPAAVGAGAASVVNGVLTQAGLNKPDPLEQWQAVEDAVGGSFDQLADGMQIIYKDTLGNKDHKNIAEFDAGLPQILYDGGFVEPAAVDVIDPDIYSAVSAVAINALWLMDRVFIVKLTDKVYNNGKACDVYSKKTVCIDGIAYIVARWAWNEGFAVGEGGIIWATLDYDKWNAWGAYKDGSAAGEDNANHLPEFGLDLEDIVRQSIKTQKEHGFLFQDQTELTIESVQDSNLDLTTAELTYWNLPICDIEKTIGEGKYLASDYDDGSNNDDPGYKMLQWIGCTCLQMKGWPEGKYADADGGVTTGWAPSECRKKGWKDI